MKKRFILGISFTLIALLLTSCSAASNGNKKTLPANNEQQSSKKETRLYKHAMGETEIPVKPERVITLQYASQMISVGLKPIGAVDYLLDNQFPDFNGIESIGSREAINYEKMLAMEPDLIIAGDLEQDVYDKLSKIAPTVVVPWMAHDLFGHVEIMGDILNRQEEAKSWKAEFDKKIAAAREKIIGAIGEDKTVAIYRVDPKEFSVYGVRNIGFTLYKALGLHPPASVQKELDKNPDLWGIQISLEVLPQYDADYVFVTTLGTEETEQEFNRIKNSSLWKNLSSVKNNRVYSIDMDTWLGYTPHNVEVQLDEATKLLQEAK
ncbi:ABC transporter substrate-binding protein [Paenibacillus sp. NPDC058071]|uniref:ABC transporter substrate-binding protein n=1 Tax=Paenibacillus sp. NPDC058071 TaxID=3346326 RepID=UPI0036DE611C